MPYNQQPLFGVPAPLSSFLLVAWILWGGSLIYLFAASRTSHWTYQTTRFIRQASLSFVTLIGATLLWFFQKPDQALRMLDIDAEYRLLPPDVTLLMTVNRASITMIVLFLIIAVGYAFAITIALNQRGFVMPLFPARRPAAVSAESVPLTSHQDDGIQKELPVQEGAVQAREGVVVKLTSRKGR